MNSESARSNRPQVNNGEEESGDSVSFLGFDKMVFDHLGRLFSSGISKSEFDDVCIPLKDVTPSANNNVTTQFILLDKARTVKEPDIGATTCLALVADDTAAIHFQFWGDECDSFHPGDILRLTNGIFSYGGNRNTLLLRAGKRGSIEKVGEFTMNYVETPNISEIRWVPDGASGRYVQESVVSQYSHIFPPLR